MSAGVCRQVAELKIPSGVLWGDFDRGDVPHGVPPEVFPCFQSSISRNVASAAPVILLPLEALPSSALAFSSLRRLLKMQLHQPSRLRFRQS
jgi:hypothetical protein